MLLVQKCCLPHYPTWDPREGSSVLKLNIITGDISKTSNKTCQGHLSLWQVLRVLWKISPCYPEPHIPCAHHQGGRSGLPLESPSTQQSYPYQHKTVARGFKSSPCWNMLGHSWEGGGGVLKILTSVKQLGWAIHLFTCLGQSSPILHPLWECEYWDSHPCTDTVVLPWCYCCCCGIFYRHLGTHNPTQPRNPVLAFKGQFWRQWSPKW